MDLKQEILNRKKECLSTGQNIYLQVIVLQFQLSMELKKQDTRLKISSTGNRSTVSAVNGVEKAGHGVKNIIYRYAFCSFSVLKKQLRFTYRSAFRC